MKRKLVFLIIFAFAISISSQAIARPDKSIGEECYKSYKKQGGNQVIACIYTQCQEKYNEENITLQIQCQMVANKEFHDLLSKGKEK